MQYVKLIWSSHLDMFAGIPNSGWGWKFRAKPHILPPRLLVWRVSLESVRVIPFLVGFWVPRSPFFLKTCLIIFLSALLSLGKRPECTFQRFGLGSLHDETYEVWRRKKYMTISHLGPQIDAGWVRGIMSKPFSWLSKLCDILRQKLKTCL